MSPERAASGPSEAGRGGRPWRRRLAAAGLAVAASGLACSAPVEVDFSGPTAGWPEYGGGKGGGHYFPLTQITPENVDRLEVAWVHHTGDVFVSDREDRPGSSFQATPIVVGDALVFCTPFNRVVALDAESGDERWSYDPQVDREKFYLLNCRGVSAWTGAASDGPLCRRRIFTGTIDARLIALDAATGRPCPRFGDAGQVDLSGGVGDFAPGEYGVTSPPAVVGDVVVVGTMVLDNLRVDVPGGVVRGYDARTGALRWAWDPIPPGARPAPDGRFRRGTTNAWSILSADPALGLVYVPTGNTSPDFYGGHREGLDHYSSSVVALDAGSGEVVWHFQTVHHDVWDYDVPAQPTLLAYPGEAGPVPALVQSTKMGHLFFLDRRSGEPIFPVEERPVPGGGVPGEALSPTQPFPTRPPPIHPARLSPDDAWGLTPWDRGRCRERIASLRNEGIFTPPSEEDWLLYPGPGGGGNWGGLSIDPARGVLVVNTVRAPFWMRLVPREEFDRRPGGAERPGAMAGTPYGIDAGPLLSPLGAPCNPPPWGTLVGVDVASGEILYDVPLGTTRDMAPFPFWLELGVPGIGGPTSTASGLTFIGATSDDFLRAFDTRTGRELWRGRLPAGGQATPMTYRLRADSRQLVVIAAGGHGMLRTTPGDALVAFALPAPAQ